jgi:hypothetical protein
MIKVKRTPVPRPPRARRRAFVSSDSRLVLIFVGDGGFALDVEAALLAVDFVAALGGDGGLARPSNFRPVTRARTRRMVALRHRMTRVTRMTRACQERSMVPKMRMTRRVVMMRRGGSVRRNQNGMQSRMRTKRVVSAGRVVADVGVRWVLRKSVSSSSGSSSMLHLAVNSLSVSTISSNVF